MERRRFLQMMLATPVILSMPVHTLLAAPADGETAQLLRASELLTGRRGLDSGIAARLWTLLCTAKIGSRSAASLTMTR